MLDTGVFSPIIYILYEGGSLSPPVGRLGAGNQAGQPHSKEEEWRRRLRAERRKAARSGRPRRQPVPGVFTSSGTPSFLVAGLSLRARESAARRRAPTRARWRARRQRRCRGAVGALATANPDEGRDTLNGEEGQGREKEGRQEAVSRLHPYEKRGRRSPPFPSAPPACSANASRDVEATSITHPAANRTGSSRHRPRRARAE